MRDQHNYDCSTKSLQFWIIICRRHPRIYMWCPRNINDIKQTLVSKRNYICEILIVEKINLFNVYYHTCFSTDFPLHKSDTIKLFVSLEMHYFSHLTINPCKINAIPWDYSHVNISNQSNCSVGGSFQEGEIWCNVISRHHDRSIVMMAKLRFGIFTEQEQQLIIDYKSGLNIKAVIKMAKKLLGTYLNEWYSINVNDSPIVKIMSLTHKSL